METWPIPRGYEREMFKSKDFNKVLSSLMKERTHWMLSQFLQRNMCQREELKRMQSRERFQCYVLPK